MFTYHYFGFCDKDIVICRILKVCLFLGVLLSMASAEAIEIITNKSVNITSISKTQLRRIYSMRQLVWQDKSAIIVFVLPSQHPSHKKFSQELLNIFPYKLDRIWNKLTFSGLGVAPTVIKTQEELIMAVSSTKGAIGYIDGPVGNINKEEQVNVIDVSK